MLVVLQTSAKGGRKTMELKEAVITELQNAIYLLEQGETDWLDEREIPVFQMAIDSIEKISKIEKIVEEGLGDKYTYYEILKVLQGENNGTHDNP